MPLIKLKFWKSNSRRKNESESASSTNPKVVKAAHSNNEQCGLIMLFPDAHALSVSRDIEQNSNVSEGTFEVDIVAVHGVNGDAYSTWTHKNGKLWLRDFLPSQIPGARIFSFSYDSTTAFSQPSGDISDFACSLLDSVQGERLTVEDKSRKILFLCHSMGGILVKKALIIANENQDVYRDVLDSTSGILFFGTPHGSPYGADLPKVLANIARVAFIGNRIFSPAARPRFQLLKALKKNSIVLEEISTSFTQQTVGLKIVTLYEQYLTVPPGIKVVERKSATIGVANEHLIPLEADHREICRFGREESLLYRPVWKKIKEIVEETAKPC